MSCETRVEKVREVYVDYDRYLFPSESGDGNVLEAHVYADAIDRLCTEITGRGDGEGTGGNLYGLTLGDLRGLKEICEKILARFEKGDKKQPYVV